MGVSASRIYEREIQMTLLIIIAVIYFIFNSSKKEAAKRKAQEEQKRQEDQAELTQPAHSVEVIESGQQPPPNQSVAPDSPPARPNWKFQVATMGARILLTALIGHYARNHRGPNRHDS